MSPLWRHLVRSSMFWLYVGLAIVCVGAILTSAGAVRAATGCILAGLAIEYLSIRPVIKRWRQLQKEDPAPRDNAEGGAGTGGPSA